MSCKPAGGNSRHHFVRVVDASASLVAKSEAKGLGYFVRLDGTEIGYGVHRETLRDAGEPARARIGRSYRGACQSVCHFKLLADSLRYIKYLRRFSGGGKETGIQHSPFWGYCHFARSGLDNPIWAAPKPR